MSESQPFEDQGVADNCEVYLTLDDLLGLYAELGEIFAGLKPAPHSTIVSPD